MKTIRERSSLCILTFDERKEEKKTPKETKAKILWIPISRRPRNILSWRPHFSSPDSAATFPTAPRSIHPALRPRPLRPPFKFPQSTSGARAPPTQSNIKPGNKRNLSDGHFRGKVGEKLLAQNQWKLACVQMFYWSVFQTLKILQTFRRRGLIHLSGVGKRTPSGGRRVLSFSKRNGGFVFYTAKWNGAFLSTVRERERERKKERVNGDSGDDDDPVGKISILYFRCKNLFIKITLNLCIFPKPLSLLM